MSFIHMVVINLMIERSLFGIVNAIFASVITIILALLLEVLAGPHSAFQKRLGEIL